MKKLFAPKKPKVNLAQYAEKETSTDLGKSFENMTRLIQLKQKYADKFNKLSEDRDSVFQLMTQVARRDIPELAKAIGQWLFKLPDGTQVEITQKLEANPPKKSINQVYKWLEKTGAGSLIKKQIILEFDKTKEGQKLFEQTEDILREKGLEYGVKQNVHKASLEKHLNQCREKGIQIDKKFLGAFDLYDTVINGVKTPKKA